jgi:hypothetical protein
MFNSADAEAIARIKLPNKRVDDFLAWQREKSGRFTVRSAYNLAMIMHQEPDVTASSSRPEDDMILWSNTWNRQVPPKVRIFAWKLSRDILPTERNKFKRRLELEDKCDLCGMERECSFHAVINCQGAKQLRQAMREHWNLPTEEHFLYTGTDWLLLLLGQCSAEQKKQTLLLLWRAWTVQFTNRGLTQSVTLHFLLSF